jgi:hypothetical protein
LSAGVRHFPAYQHAGDHGRPLAVSMQSCVAMFAATATRS